MVLPNQNSELPKKLPQSDIDRKLSTQWFSHEDKNKRKNVKNNNNNNKNNK